MELLFLAIGIAIGGSIVKILYDRNTAYGTFDLEPGEDPDVTNLRIKIFNNQDLYSKKRISLYRDSHK